MANNSEQGTQLMSITQGTNSNANSEGERKSSVRDLVRQFQENKTGGRSSQATSRSSGRLSFKRSGGRLTENQPSEALPPPVLAQPLQPLAVAKKEFTLEPIDLKMSPKESLQANLRCTVGITNRRMAARKDYTEKQKELQREYEAKVKKLHEEFVTAEGDLVNVFEEKEKVTDAKRRQELDNLKDMWFFIEAHKWDMLLSRNSLTGYKPDVFQKLRTGVEFKNSGDATNFVVDLLKSESENFRFFANKNKKMMSNLTRSVLGIRKMDDNANNRNTVINAIASRMDNPELSKRLHSTNLLRDVVESLGDVSVEMEKNLSRAEIKFDRKVIVRVVHVDEKAEKVRLVLVMDRNGRPCVGGLPKEQQEQKKDYSGDDKILKESDIKEKVEEAPKAEQTTTEATEENANTENAEEVVENAQEEANQAEEDEEKIEGYCTSEQEAKGREFTFPVEELLYTKGIEIIDKDTQDLLKMRFNEHVPHITYQRIAGFQGGNLNLNDGNRRRRDVFDDQGDFQIVDLGLKLGLEPLQMMEEYDQSYRNGVLQSVKHTIDGPVRFVGYNETGFGFVEDRPIEMHVQKVVDEAGNVQGVNILHMALFDMNDQICFDTLYLKDDEDMAQSKTWKVFGKDAIGNRLAYRVVAQKGEVKAILYPFQGRVKRAKLNIKDVSHLTEDIWVNIRTEGQDTLRLGKVKNIPTGMVIGKITEEKKGMFPQTPFLEMIRMRQRVMTEMPGMIDIEIHTEDSQLLDSPRDESWPVECLSVATQSQISFLNSLQAEKAEVLKEIQEETKRILEDVKNFTNDREKRKNKEEFLQEAEELVKQLEGKKSEAVKDIEEEIDSVLSALKKTMDAVKRALALENRQSKKLGQ